jgi:putative DNA methylase
VPRKKLIEVSLPLEAINKESAREKSIRHGHPSTLHLWWARRPLAACRAVLFASLVDDPSAHPDRFPTEEAQQAERLRLFGIIEELVKWENSNNEAVLAKARAEIRRSCDGDPPPVLDPFCGGGSIPLEAQRLGLTAYASDLNPVAVLITKALVEIPPKFASRSPVHPDGGRMHLSDSWQGAQGLAEDIRYYGRWMRDEAEKRMGHLYHKVRLPKEQGGGEATVIAWLWARTVKCPIPACGAQTPLVRSFAPSTKKGNQPWVEPIVDVVAKTVRFEVRTGQGRPQEGTVSRRGARCIVCGSPVPFDHIRAEGKAGRMGARLMAIVAEGQRGRVYLEDLRGQAYVKERGRALVSEILRFDAKHRILSLCGGGRKRSQSRGNRLPTPCAEGIPRPQTKTAGVAD